MRAQLQCQHHVRPRPRSSASGRELGGLRLGELTSGMLGGLLLAMATRTAAPVWVQPRMTMVSSWYDPVVQSADFYQRYAALWRTMWLAYASAGEPLPCWVTIIMASGLGDGTVGWFRASRRRTSSRTPDSRGAYHNVIV